MSATLAVQRWSKLADRNDAVHATIQAIRSRIDAHQAELGRIQAAMSLELRDPRASVVAGDDGLAYSIVGGREHVRVGGRMELRGIDTRTRRPEFDQHVRRLAELQAETRRLRGEIDAQAAQNGPVARLVSEGRRLLEAHRIRIPPR